MDNITKVKHKIVALWKQHLHPNDFKQQLAEYLQQDADWQRTAVNVEGSTLHLQLYTTTGDGYTLTVKLKKPPHIELKQQ